MAGQNSVSDFKQFARKYQLGGALDKKNATHHDDYFSYYVFSDDEPTFSQIRRHVVKNYFNGTPLSLNEHASTEWPHCLYLDVDCNKGDHVTITDPFVKDGLMCVYITTTNTWKQ